MAGNKTGVGWPRLARSWEAEPGLCWAERRKELSSACRSFGGDPAGALHVVVAC